MKQKNAVIGLHNHTIFSDGSDLPRQFVEKAKAEGALGLSKTDHNTHYGTKEFLQACLEFEIDSLTGIEITTAHKNIDIHILGYGYDITKTSILDNSLKSCYEMYIARAEIILSKYKQAGIPLDSIEEIKKEVGIVGPVIMPIHLAFHRAKKYGISFQSAMKETARGGFARVGYLNNYLMSPPEVVELIKSVGGVAVLAHPGEFFSRNDGDVSQTMMILQEVIDMTKEAGLLGIEAHHIKHSPKQNEQFVQLAKDNGLFTTAGSDYHGTQAPGRPICMPGMNYDDFLKLKKLCL